MQVFEIAGFLKPFQPCVQKEGQPGLFLLDTLRTNGNIVALSSLM
jgi:hypothetical protein